MKHKILAVLAVSVFVAGSAQNINTKKLDSYFDALERNHKVMGSFAVAQNDQVVYTKAIGFADVSSGKKADINTVYRIGSVSKTFTAVLVMKAVEEKKLNLDDKLSSYFPQIKNAEKITVEQLLNHRSGIHNFTDDSSDYLTYNTMSLTQQQLLEKIVKGESSFAPGTAYEYSNANYILLALILEKIYKKPYSELLTEKITKPLGLKATRIGETIDPRSNTAASYEWYSENYIKTPETHMSIPVGAGNLVSTPSELLTFASALENNKMLSAGSLAKMKKWTDGYGYGIFPVPFNDKKGYGHTGGIDSFNSVLFYFPDGKNAVAFITNQSSYDNNQIAITALQAAYGKDFTVPDFKTVNVPEAELKKYEGTYSAPGFPLKLTISVRDGQLFGQGTGQPEFPLQAVSPTIFTFDTAGIEMQFLPEKKQMNFSQMSNKLTFTKE